MAASASHHATNLTLIVPLDYEQRILRRCLHDVPIHIRCVGMGRRGIERLAEQTNTRDPNSPRAMRVLLAGVAGGLNDRCAVGSAHWIGNVVIENGETLTPTLLPAAYRETPHLLPSITTTDSVLHDPALKRALAERTGADLADMESSHVARLARERGWDWGIVRGISDGPLAQWPTAADQWIDQAGRTRLGVVIGSLLRQPRMLASLLRMRRDTQDALHAVADRLRTVAVPRDDRT